ncbi:MAG TPA: hypothetical protein VMR34_05165 [Candidatus Saccharimonadales bacterium]|nr:hypothetical protein [Candidatus Saccharimonadales bacterium]
MNFKLVLIIVGAALIFGGIIWLIFKLTAPKLPHIRHLKPGQNPSATDHLDEPTKEVVRSIFTEEFREELRNRGRIHFEKIIGDNAMFLQQDLQLTTSQINDYMKQEITKKLQEEFSKYEQSIVDAKQVAIDSIQKTRDVIDRERQTLSEQVRNELTQDKQMLLKHFEENMGEIVNHYLLAAIGNQIDLTDQLEFILGELERNKKAILQDISDGAS